MSIYTQDIKRYLLGNFEVDEAAVDSAIATDAAKGRDGYIGTGVALGSHPFYPGDQIAEAAGWKAIEDPPEGTYPGYPEDEDDWADDDDEWDGV